MHFFNSLMMITLLIAPFGTSLPCDGFHGYGSRRIESADTCYVYFSQFLPKDTVETDCYEKGLQLVMFETTSEQNWLKNKLGGFGLYTTLWTAGQRVSGVWKWYDSKRDVTMGTISTSRISNPSSGDNHLILDPGPNIITPRGVSTYHYYICETQAQPPTTTTVATEAVTTGVITTEMESTTLEETTTIEPTTVPPVTPTYHCDVLQSFNRVYHTVQRMRMIQNETLTSRTECLVKCTKLNTCDLVEIDKVDGYCSLLGSDAGHVNTYRECSSSMIDCFLRV